ncbi:hypothetical protein LINPERHAP1_LOCUS30153 [Linum perenne]
MQTAGKSPSPRGEVVCLRKLKSSPFSVMLRLLSSSSPILESSLISPALGLYSYFSILIR